MTWNRRVAQLGPSSRPWDLWYYADSNPPMSQMGHRTLERIRAEEPRVP
jgi:hypothetical protein